jgi:hypothetical protein
VEAIRTRRCFVFPLCHKSRPTIYPLFVDGGYRCDEIDLEYNSQKGR